MDSKKVILINSRTPSSYDVENRYIPLGLMYLGSYIESLGYSVQIKDVPLEFERMTDLTWQKSVKKSRENKSSVK